jgi:type II secretory pathway component PulC
MTGGEQAAARIALNGILLTDDRRVALLRFDNDSKVMHVAEGQEAGGWLIKKITSDRVIVGRGQQESEILLDFKRTTSQQGAVPVPVSPAESEAEVYDEGDQPD